MNNFLQDPSYKATEENALKELEILRSSIDNLDAALIHILAERFRYTQKIGHLKANFNFPAFDGQRREQQIKHLCALAQSAGLDPEFAEKINSFIAQHVVLKHEEIKKSYQTKPEKIPHL